MTFEQLQKAVEILDLPQKATMQEIKTRHRFLAKRFHPDNGGNDAEKIREINEAYSLVMAYCRNYNFSFSREEFYQQVPEERLRLQFEQGPF